MIKLEPGQELLEREINREIGRLEMLIVSVKALGKVTSAETRPQPGVEGQLRIHQEGEAVQLAMRYNGRNYTVDLTAE